MIAPACLPIVSRPVCALIEHPLALPCKEKCSLRALGKAAAPICTVLAFPLAGLFAIVGGVAVIFCTPVVPL